MEEEEEEEEEEETQLVDGSVEFCCSFAHTSLCHYSCADSPCHAGEVTVETRKSPTTMQNENEDVIKLRKASKMATVEGIRTVAQIMKKLIHDPWIQSEVYPYGMELHFSLSKSSRKYFMITRASKLL